MRRGSLLAVIAALAGLAGLPGLGALPGFSGEPGSPSLALGLPSALAAQERPGGRTDAESSQSTRPPVGRRAVEELAFPPLDFDPPRVEERTLSSGVRVLFLEDHSFPLVDFYVRFQGGYARFDRAYYAAGTAMPTLLRTGGTRSLPPDSVDHRMEFLALVTTFGSGGESVYSSLNTLTGNVDEAVSLWSQMLREPGFDSVQVEIWRGRSLEGVRRRSDNPTSLAFSEFNRLMFGDDPTGWEMTSEDLEPERLSRERLEWLHRRILCKQNMILGVAGDLTWDRAEALLEGALAEWPDCTEPVPEERSVRPRSEGGVFLIPRDLTQSIVVMAEPGGVRSTDLEAYHAATIANAILGGGGFTSRLMSRVRSGAGLAYSVSSLWTTPSRGGGIVGALTQTRADATIRATRLILQTMREMTEEPPTEEEVRTAVDEIANGFVFNFENPGQIVSRQLLYLSRDLPGDWLERYVEGIQRVRPDDVHEIVAENLDPDAMTVLIVGDTARFDLPPDSLGLGEARVLEVE